MVERTKKTKTRIVNALWICLAIFIVLVIGVLLTAMPVATSVTISNDTSHTVQIWQCGDTDASILNPSARMSTYEPRNSPDEACRLYTNNSNAYLGCLPTPTTNSNNLTFRVSNLKKDIPENRCGK